MDAMSSFADAFDHWAQVMPERPAVRDARSCLTWAELRAASERLAAAIGAAAETSETVGLLAKRSPPWLAATLALLRLGRPFAWMGAELPKAKRPAELRRNEEILEVLRPGLVLLGDNLPPEALPDFEALPQPPRLLRIGECLASAPAPPLRPAPLVPPRRAERGALMCFQLTGGTTGGSKVVEVTHAMALHELAAYPKAFPELSHEDRVLQHTPVLWAASALGQIDVAVSVGATICIAETLDQDALRELQPTVLGVVPSSLESLQPAEAKTVRWIFTWGETLPPALGSRWAERRRVVELLISTEYWLSLYSAGRSSEGRSIYKAVPGAEVAVATDGQVQRHVGATGELCLRGPMVTTGYRGLEGSSFIDAGDGAPYFKTSDLVTLVGSDPTCLEFRGRSDMLVKVGGQFVDLLEAEMRLKAALLPPPESTATASAESLAQEVAVLPGSAGGPRAHVFVSASDGSGAAAARLIQRARGALPGSALHLLGKALPKDPISNKVDRRSLLGGLVGEMETQDIWPVLRARLQTQLLWLTVMGLPGVVDLSLRNISRRMRVLGLGLHLWLVPYLWLLSLHVPVRQCRYVINYVPFGRVGLLCLWYHLARGAGRTALLARGALAVAAGAGVVLAARLNAVLPWWVAFWLAIPETAQGECDWWLKKEGWKWYGDELVEKALSAPSRSVVWGDNLLQLVLDLPSHLGRLRSLKPEPYELPEELCARPQADEVKAGTSPGAGLGLASSTGTEPEPAEAASSPEAAPFAACAKVEVEEAGPEAAAPATSVEATEEAASSPEAAAPAACTEPEVEKVGSPEAAAPAVSEPKLPEVADNFGAFEGASEPEWSCEECRVPLPWGSDWRQEAELFYCRSCHKGFDDRWWDFHTRDVVELEVAADEAEADASGEGSSECDLRPRTLAGQELLRWLPRQQPRLSEARLSGVDSLAVLTLCRQLRLAVPGLRLRPQDVFQCDTLGELLTLVEGCPLDAADDLPAPSYGPGESRAVWFTPGQVNNTCKWLYGCKGLLDEGCFRRACARLLGRHEGLRAELGPVGMEMLRFLRDVPALHAPLWPQLEPRARKLGLARPLRACKELCAWGLKHSWPRSHPRPVTRQFLEERVLVVRCKSWRDLELAYSRLREEWRSPVAIALFLLERGREEKSMSTWERPEDWRGPTSFLQFIVSHAWSDGFCGVPLVQDFSALYVQEEAAAGKGSGVCQASLLPLPNGAAFQALESRLFAALDCQPGWSHPDQMSLRSAIFDETPKWTPWVYNHEVLLEASAVAGLRSCAGRTFDVHPEIFPLKVNHCGL
ncbi:unnamed protein product [Effrenium voratum]|uniref:AMP-dependent synthetase/ligase domain-containing protein n=1 Tax=Effrenium voratum TaxID=2562239 RepID=A0AA36N5S6_9DINO|nr:unnamed protein product [Effrenium voratum]